VSEKKQEKKQEKEWAQFSTTYPKTFLRLLRLQAFKEEVSRSEMIQRYQQAYLRELEREKTEKKGKGAKKEEEK